MGESQQCRDDDSRNVPVDVAWDRRWVEFDGMRMPVHGLNTNTRLTPG